MQLIFSNFTELTILIINLCSITLTPFANQLYGLLCAYAACNRIVQRK